MAELYSYSTVQHEYMEVGQQNYIVTTEVSMNTWRWDGRII